MAEEELFAEGTAVGLELARFVELVAEIRPRLSYFAILFLIPHQQIGYIFLKLAQLDIAEVVVHVEDGSFDVDHGVCSGLSSLAKHKINITLAIDR